MTATVLSTHTSLQGKEQQRARADLKPGLLQTRQINNRKAVTILGVGAPADAAVGVAE